MKYTLLTHIQFYNCQNCSSLAIDSINIFIFTFNWFTGSVTYLNFWNRWHKCPIVIRKLTQSLVQLRVSQLKFIKQRRPSALQLHASLIQRWQLKALSSSIVQLEQNLANDKSLYLVNSKPRIQWYSINFHLVWLIKLFIEIMLLLQLAVLSPTTKFFAGGGLWQMNAVLQFRVHRSPCSSFCCCLLCRWLESLGTSGPVWEQNNALFCSDHTEW